MYRFGCVYVSNSLSLMLVGGQLRVISLNSSEDNYFRMFDLYEYQKKNSACYFFVGPDFTKKLSKKLNFEFFFIHLKKKEDPPPRCITT